MDVLALFMQAAALARAMIACDFGHEQVQAFSDRSGAHEQIKHLLRFADPVTGFFFDLGNHGRCRIAVVKQTRRNFDQHAVFMAVHEGW